MDRREFLPAILALAAPTALEAQQAERIARIGVLSFTSPNPFQDAFRQALVDLGYVEGHNVATEHFPAGGDLIASPTLPQRSSAPT